MTMRMPRMIVSGAVLAAMLAGGAWARPASAQADGPTLGEGARQRGQRQRGQRQAGRALAIATVPVAVLDAELTLTTDQKAKITAIQDRIRAENRQAIGNTGATPGAPGERVRNLRELTEKARQEIEGILTADQKAKVPALIRELAPLRMAGVPLQVYRDLKLTDEQKKQIADAVEASRGKLREAARGGDRSQAAGIRAEMRSQVQAILTADQKTVIGKYEKEHPRRGRGRNGA